MVVVFIVGSSVEQAVAGRNPVRQSWVCRRLDCPDYRTVYEGPNFEVRQYEPATWLVTHPVTTFSFETATFVGLRPILDYIQGHNCNWTLVPMTAPLVTSVVLGAGPFASSGFQVLFLVPKSLADNPPVPLADSGLVVDRWKGRRCMIVRKFSGFAKDRSVLTEAAALAAALPGTNWEPVLDQVRTKGDSAYSIAQYDPPFEIFQRMNEVWVNFQAVDAEEEYSQCLPDVEPPPVPPTPPSTESPAEADLLQINFR
ncbi:hypothetical protein CBR_g48158 [Chara braunii]|uniref:SOUL heme-binding protein n=1 Tax=Chara braunii TaxID=69332 RepID=A0A388M223_CHABU|nr:hypothetical protein CBR_g48158 [Chara braunii]|eukprot:GBG88627.1 hypothetical protein CBR_g48158 [Chara braunii]